MSRRPALAAAALAAAAALPACVPLEKGRQIEARVQRLEVQSVEGKGSAFACHFPASRVAPRPVT